jgi:hypothetical protein
VRPSLKLEMARTMRRNWMAAYLLPQERATSTEAGHAPGKDAEAAFGAILNEAICFPTAGEAGFSPTSLSL